MRKAIVLAGLLSLTACGSDPPTSVGTPNPPPPPAASVDWEALEEIFGDPLYLRLPNLLLDQQAASELKIAVGTLVAAIAAENLDLVRQELLVIAQERAEYQARAGYNAQDRPLLTAMAILEMGGQVHVTAAGAAGLTTQPESQGGDR